MTKKNEAAALLRRYKKQQAMLRAAGSPWVDAPLRTGTGAFNIPTIDESLYWDYVAGIISLHETAVQFCKAGWDNFVDEEATMGRLIRIDAKYNKLNNLQS